MLIIRIIVTVLCMGTVFAGIFLGTLAFGLGDIPTVVNWILAIFIALGVASLTFRLTSRPT